MNQHVYNKNTLFKNTPYQSSVGKCTLRKFPLEIEANFAQLQTLYASLPSRNQHGFLNGSSDMEVYIKSKLFKITSFIFLLYIMFILLCHGDIEQNPGPFTNKKIRDWQKILCHKKESLLEHHKQSYIENLVKRKADARKLSLIEYGNNSEKKKIASKNQYMNNPEKKRAISRINYMNNPEKKRAISRVNYMNNPEIFPGLIT